MEQGLLVGRTMVTEARRSNVNSGIIQDRDHDLETEMITHLMLEIYVAAKVDASQGTLV